MFQLDTNNVLSWYNTEFCLILQSTLRGNRTRQVSLHSIQEKILHAIAYLICRNYIIYLRQFPSANSFAYKLDSLTFDCKSSLKWDVHVKLLFRIANFLSLVIAMFHSSSNSRNFYPYCLFIPWTWDTVQNDPLVCCLITFCNHRYSMHPILASVCWIM